MVRLTAALSCAFISLAATSTAQAGLIKAFKKSDSKTVTIEKVKANLHHVRFVCDMGKGKVEKQHCRAAHWLGKWLRELTAPMSSLSIPHYSAWLCIHKYEGSWTDSGDPYWGGLQMDRGFMSTYAPSWLLNKGWANSWTPLEQMWVAERAFSSGRGFTPWPNTARDCGLL